MDKTYIPSPTELYDEEMHIFAGVEGAGKTSMLGAWTCLRQKAMETTLTGEDIRYIRQKYDAGCRIYMKYIGLDTLEEHFGRIENRVRKGGASADLEDIKAQFASRWEALNQVFPLCDEIRFYDNTNGFKCVGQYIEHQMTVAKSSCQWFREYLSDWYLNVQPATEPREHIFQSRLSMGIIEDNFSDMSFLDELMEGLREAPAHAKEMSNR